MDLDKLRSGHIVEKRHDDGISKIDPKKDAMEKLVNELTETLGCFIIRCEQGNILFSKPLNLTRTKPFLFHVHVLIFYASLLKEALRALLLDERSQPYLLTETHQHRGDLRSDSVTLRVKFLITHTLNHTVHRHPVHRLIRPLRYLICIIEVQWECPCACETLSFGLS